MSYVARCISKISQHICLQIIKAPQPQDCSGWQTFITTGWRHISLSITLYSPTYSHLQPRLGHGPPRCHCTALDLRGNLENLPRWSPALGPALNAESPRNFWAFFGSESAPGCMQAKFKVWWTGAGLPQLRKMFAFSLSLSLSLLNGLSCLDCWLTPPRDGSSHVWFYWGFSFLFSEII